MSTMTAVPMSSPAAAPIPAHNAPARFALLGRSVVVMVSSMTGAVLFSLWLTVVALSPLTLLAPLVLPVTSWVRAYANRHRRGAHELMGVHIAEPYRARTGRGVIGRVWALLRDPASWRDAWWLLAHAVTACVTSALSVALFLGGIFYLIYPFLFWVTPAPVFDNPFGPWQLHSVAQSALVMPVALVCFGLWYLLAIPLTRVEVRLTQSLLSRRRESCP